MSGRREWLEADGLGGFASGTVSGIRRRRYHALLLTATSPPTGRFVLVNGVDVFVQTGAGTFALSSQRYLPDATHPDGERRIESFTCEPWPRWTFALEDGTRIEQELLVRKGSALVGLAWRLIGAKAEATLIVRPFLSGRGYHALHHENPDFRFDAEVRGERVSWQPYASVPGITAVSNGIYRHEAVWYRNFLYEDERDRGLDHIEDLAAPGTFSFDLALGEALLLFSNAETEGAAASLFGDLQAAERKRRASFPSRLQAAADAYFVRRGDGRTIVAGYPWFTDWGRDTFVSLRGLALATGRLEETRRILGQWAGAVSEGMLPNRFVDGPAEAPEFNAVDASLWYVVAVYEFLAACAARGTAVAANDRAALLAAVEAILEGYTRGTRFGIRVDADGLLAAGEPGVQLTWMDARVGDYVVTPRIGKPVEVQALWLNALHLASASSDRGKDLLARGLQSFAERFWNEEAGALYDVVDADHVPGRLDGSFRPNQILAVGGLPLALLTGERARRVVDAVEARLLTPLGLRSLAREEPGYRPRYEGGAFERDGAYHQGTVWPWLLGPFVEAWVRVRGGTPDVVLEARERFLPPFARHLDEAGLGHVSEIADGDAPHAPRGCPFQAWSVGEILRLDLVVLRDLSAKASPGPTSSP